MQEFNDKKKKGKWASWVYIIQMACTSHPVFEEENDISSFESMFFELKNH